MLKSVFFTLFLVLALTFSSTEAAFSISLPQGNLFIAQATIESPQPEATQSPPAAKTELPTAKTRLNKPDCNKETTDSADINLSNDCEQTPEVSSSRVAYPQPPHPYDMEAIKKFNQELYGEGN